VDQQCFQFSALLVMSRQRFGIIVYQHIDMLLKDYLIQN